ncbi:MAG TPA: ABC transporter ATP-binding protein [Bacillota bacterium]|jgi:ABC-2 type transport system ATP-binding protein|nr:ABC transporter ATP-binding protein [Bacillota bacterium]HOP69311.1 ABC transporter ATP-binding protein [Bacillota bacterium]HPT34339.1 ABC transporter ATP-binding protein [Bacillota bacterium]HQD05528.1 ABC transporter ATP-binding protein [Bacillota bacterium]
MVKVSGLTKRYKGLTAVDGISFEIPRGAVFGLLGPNGAGKSTTVSMLSGLIRPDAGEISIEGLDLWRRPLQAKAAMGIVPQEIALYPSLTARENLKFWGRLYRLGGRELSRRVEEVLDLVGLRERANEPLEKYSGGMKRRINIAAGLLHNPRLLILDEPTVGVDPQSRRAILETIKELNRQGLTVLYTSHYMEEVEELCSLVTIMDRGRIIASGRVEELLQLVMDTEVINLEMARPLENGALLEGVPGVKGVLVEENRARVMVEESRKNLAPVIEAVTAGGISVLSVVVEKPSLEAVFLHLTGRGLRDGG